MEKDSPSNSSAPPQLQSTRMVTSLSLPQVSGATPTIASVCDQQALDKIQDTLEAILRGNKKVVTEAWVDEMVELAERAIAFRDPELMLEFARSVKDKLGIEGPQTGAFWSDEKEGQDKARESLISSSGKVLADSQLGDLARRFKLSPQRPKSKDDKVTESLEAFHERNRIALMFWGGVSKLYAEGLEGEVHVCLPKGLTMGSIFWNDELPMLRKQLDKKTITALWFHVRDEKSGQWSGNLTFDKLKIVDVYLMDAGGVNKGAESLLHETEPSLKGKLKPKSYHMELGTPIQIATLQAGFRNALARARARLAQSGDGATMKQ